MRLFRTITAVAVGLALAGLPGAAGAQPVYPPGLPSLTLSDSTITVGQTVTLFGDNFGPTETVDIDITTSPIAARAPGATNRGGGGTTVAMGLVPVGRTLPARYDPGTLQVSTDAEGDFRIRYRPRYPAEYTFTAVGRESGRTASANLTVLRGPHLPVTGDDVGPQIAVGSGLLITGVLLMLVTFAWRRRGRRHRGEGAPEFEAVR